MRRNPMMVALAIGACLAAPAERPIDDFDYELMREKNETQRRYERLERVGDEQLRHKLTQSTPSVSALINRHTGEPHKHSREIARRLRQQARGEQS